MMEDAATMRELLRVAVVLPLGVIGIMVAAWAAGHLMKRRASSHVSTLVRKFILYAGAVVLLLTVLSELGFNLTGLVATAGIATVAIGFAAQTSLSNLISGLFLIGEKPFQIGDLVRIGTTTGTVESIDLLSVKLRTFDNLFVRIPNEEMIKRECTNITRYPIRRMDIDLRVGLREDPRRIMRILKELAAANPLVLEDPAPLIVFQNFGESALEFRFGLWFERSQFLALRNSVMTEIHERFAAEGIEIPVPYRRILQDAGPATPAGGVEGRP
jgi:small-conductance mechanosensitive channel